MDITGAEPTERLDPTGRRRDVRLALACLGGGLTLLALGVRGFNATAPTSHLVGPLVVMCAAVLLRRVAPLPAVVIGTGAGVADVLLGPSLGTLLVFSQLLYDTALYGRRWLTPWLLRLVTAATLVTTLAVLFVGRQTDAITVAVAMTLLVVLPVITVIPVRQHRDRARLERDRAEQISRLAELDRRQAVAAERARMARELHDVVANHFSAVAIHATAALSIRDLDPDKLHEILTVIRQNSVQGLGEMRQLVELLREPGDVVAGGLRPRLSGVNGLVKGAAGLEVRLVEEGGRTDLPAAVDLAAYRIVQESLTNAGKHAPGGGAEVRIGYAPDAVEIVVTSWGPAAAAGGAPPEDRPTVDGHDVAGAGMGLVGMRERATLLGGVFTAGPCADGRWLVRAVLPTGGANR